MEKIIAKEVSPAFTDFSFYFDDDGLKSAGGENCAVYIPALTRNHKGFNAEEYNSLVADAENIIDELNGGATVLEACLYALGGKDFERIKKNTRALHALKEWAKNADARDVDSIADYLTITTGETWTVRAFSGYCQGDCCKVLYCDSKYSKEAIHEIGNFWLGCGSEFIIDGVGGYFVLDTLRWEAGEKLLNTLAEYACVPPEQLEVHLYKGEHTVSDYEVMNL